MLALIVADDLTGALDSAAMFAARGMRCCVLRHPEALAAADLSDIDVCAVSTGSRESGRKQAQDAIAAVLAALEPPLPDYIFKKVDSRLKGHVGLEARLLAEGTDRTRLLVSPAIPEMGRFVADGYLTGMGVVEPIAVASRFAETGMALTIPDAKTDADLDHCGAANFETTLFVGARGLAAALARRLKPQGNARLKIRLPRPALFAIGSRDPITEIQVERLRSELDAGFLIAENGRVMEEAELLSDLTIVKMTAGKAAVAADLAGGLFADGVSALIERGQPATLLACGGETANALLERLGVERLEVLGEILPGVPLSSAVLCGKATRIITKSGGFGDADTLLRLASSLESSEDIPTAAESEP
ncbi:four-carbon acid sugar kinase family protein [Rhizobium sp. LCM 4573]|uniref:four-carbon acid sugar kinase family protein n=1 Tax=Rhizobium sp. LCM 4573 TaxID=1848291 RepID=UPI0009F29E1A|nr:four-carbon acid sugar kinase family protein [Rhizobium sp. LCM 4573]